MLLGRLSIVFLLASCLCAENPLVPLFREAISHATSTESKDLAKTASEALRAGQNQAAIDAVLAAAQHERALGQVDAAAQFEALARRARIAQEQRLQAMETVAGVSREVGLRLVGFDQVAGPISRVAVVDANVQPFIRAVLRSGNSPRAYVDSKNVEQILHAGLWEQEQDRSKCVFLAGSGKDADGVAHIKKQFEDAGYHVFFYKFCTGAGGELCQSELVGSYLRTAGQCFFVDSPAAGESPFVLPEIRTALALDQGKPVVLMITPEQLAAAKMVPGTLVRGTVFNIASSSQAQ